MSSSIIGIDVGGTKVMMGLYEGKKLSLTKTDNFPTKRERGFPLVLEDIVSHALALKREDTIALGIGVPGLISSSTGVVTTMPNIIGADHYKLKQVLEDRLNLPVFVANDSQCFALAEAREGAGKGMSVVVGITMGTGVGGGIIIHGKIFEGANGFAGEIGHSLLVPGAAPIQSENQRGEVEQFLSGTALRLRCPAARTPEDIFTGSMCSSLHPQVTREVAWLCANLTHILNPSIIIFGGAAGRSLKTFLPLIEQEIHHWVQPGTPIPSLAVRKLDDAATRGAALLTQ